MMMTHLDDVSVCSCVQGYSGPAVLDLSHWLVREMDQQQHAAMPSELRTLWCSHVHLVIPGPTFYMQLCPVSGLRGGLAASGFSALFLYVCYLVVRLHTSTVHM
jgi:hypothetical protein